MLTTKNVKTYFFLLLWNCLFFFPGYIVLGISGDFGPDRGEDSLRVLFEDLTNASTSTEREAINQEIIGVFDEILKDPESFFHPFESLNYVGKITAADGRLRVYTWNYSDSQVEHNYFGFLQNRNPENNEISLHFISQSDVNGEDFENQVFSAGEWYGALYYQVHNVVHQGKTYYTLIGFDFNNVFSNIKIIDILSFSEGVPVFGAPVFRFGEDTKYRVVFEYSSGVVMFLRYIPGREMIIYDHLSPDSPRLKGQYRYYGPDFTYDAFRFENGYWIHISDIDWSPQQ